MADRLDSKGYGLPFQFRVDFVNKGWMNMKKRRIKCTAATLSFLLLLIPLQVSAGAELEKEITIVTSDYEGAEEQAKDKFEQTIEENGKKYELTDIEYELIETKYLDKKEKSIELKEEPKKTMKEDGVEYTLKSFDKSEKVAENEVQTVTAYDDYDYEVTATDVPVAKTVTAVNKITGAEEQVICNFTGISTAGTTTVENTMTITFSNYDAAYYEWNGNYIPRNDAVPPLAGYEDSLLASVGAAEGSSVTGYYWSSEPYTVDGVVYRDAVATVQQQVQMYRANYVGQIAPQKETVYKAVYETPDTEGNKEFTIKAIATYSKVEKSYVPYVIAAGVGLALIAGLVTFILIILAKKKKQEEEQK